jgi:hypothetical protein
MVEQLKNELAALKQVNLENEQLILKQKEMIA